MKRLLAALLAVLLLAGLCACGKNDDSSNEFQKPSSDGSFAVSDEVPAETSGTGFNVNHAAELGFGLGSDTRADLIVRFGEPLSEDVSEHIASKHITMFYPFGSLNLTGSAEDEPVLTYVEITSSMAAPCGTSLGQSMTDVAEKVFTGTGSAVSSVPPTRTVLYGSDEQVPYGVYNMLTIEYTSTTTPERYSLEYWAESYIPGHYVQCIMYFDETLSMLRYTLRYT